ncbi:MAG: hypothetical protein M1510_07000 [Nitrospirae bacterium]|nr:hypothetical protein [Nitrospirota bacterium]
MSSDNYFLRIQATINSYIRENSYHLDGSEVLEAIKCAVEQTYLLMNKKVVFNIDKAPFEIVDLSGEEVRSIPFKAMFALIKPGHFLEQIKFFVERFEREKIFATFRPLKGQIIKAEVMGETFFLGSRSYEWLRVNRIFEGTIREFGNKHGIYVESGKERLTVYPKDYRTWDIASHICDETGYVMSINPHRKILRLKKQGKAVIFNLFGTLAVMPSDERIKDETYRQGEERDVVLYDVNQTAREGYQLYVSRRQIHFVVSYLASYIPEFREVRIRSIAREPGVCCKLLLQYNGNGKIRWGRYEAVLREIQNKLSGERIEFIEYRDDIESVLQQALGYSGSIKVNTFEKTAMVVTTRKGAIIGKGGVNVKLAGMLTGYKFTVLSPDEYVSVVKQEATAC